MEEKVQKRPSKKHMILTFCIGLVAIILAIWLLVALIMGIVGIFHAGDVYSEGVDTDSITAASVLKDQLDGIEPDSEEYFEILLTNLVMQDIPTFTEPNELDSEYVISFGLWQAITLNNSQGILSSGEEGQIYRVPKSLVEKLATYTLDYTDKFEHKNVDLCGTFTYNKLNGTYAIPVTYPADYLIPKVTDIAKNEKDGTVEVTVNCYQYTEEIDDPTEDEANFRKCEIFTLKKAENKDEAEKAIEPEHYTVLKMKQAEKKTEK